MPHNKTQWLLGGLLILGVMIGGIRFWHSSSAYLSKMVRYTQYPLPTPVQIVPPSDVVKPGLSTNAKGEPARASKAQKKLGRDDLLSQFDSLVDKNITPERTLDLPPVTHTATGTAATAAIFPSTPTDSGAEGRQKRKHLPMGVVLTDDVRVYAAPQGAKLLYKMRTGDILRVFPDSEQEPRLHIQPGVDVFLAATTKNIEPAGRQYPDRDGWVEKDQINIFKTEQAVEFTEEMSPMTLGVDPNFSTLDFYERAMKNPDPVVHRIVGPRLIELVSLHEDYVSSWTNLYRDPDSKIRSLALSALKARGVGNSRMIVEDLIKRLTELTKTRADGETEIEILTIIEILKDTHNPRVPAAFQSFRESWDGVQSDQIMESLEN